MLVYMALVVIEGVLVGGIYPEHYYKAKALPWNLHRSFGKSNMKT